jgi:hypothetical protein
MKFRTMAAFGAGIAVGVTVMRKLTEDDPDVVHGPQQQQQSNPALRVISDSTARISDKATVLSLDAIRRAREMIRERLDQTGDDAAWS